MAYQIFDSNGPVGHGPSINGMKELLAHLRNVISPSQYPQANMFFHNGFAQSPIRLRVELESIAKLVKDETCRKTLLELSKMAQKCKEIVILRD